MLHINYSDDFRDVGKRNIHSSIQLADERNDVGRHQLNCKLCVKQENPLASALLCPSLPELNRIMHKSEVHSISK